MLGEANFSDHGANRLGAAALMQGLADGYFIIPYTIGGYLAAGKLAVGVDRQAGIRRGEAAGDERTNRLLAAKADERRLRFIASWANCCGKTAGWRATTTGLKEALSRIPELREEFWRNVTVPGRTKS